MVKETITVMNKTGIHLRPATELSKICGRLSSDITIIVGTKRINPKSALMIAGAGINQGDTLEIRCEGDSEEADLRLVLEAIAGGLGE